MFRLVNTTTDMIGPRKAEEMIRCNTYAGQRSISLPHVQHLASEMNAGRFLKGNIAFTTIGNAKANVLMNGQHQLNAIIASGKAVKLTVDYYHCDDNTDSWHLFAKFDVHRPRSRGHIMSAARVMFANEALSSVPLRTLSMCGTALTWLGGGIKPVLSAAPKSKSDVPDLVEKYADDVLWLHSMLSNDTNRKVTVTFAAVMIATHRASSIKADKFWPNVLGGFELVRKSPQWQLNNIMNNGIYNALNSYSAGRYFKMWNIVATWWNAYATGEQRRIVQAESMKSLVEIKS